MSNGNRVLKFGRIVAGEDITKFFLLLEQGTIKLSSCDANQNMDCLEVRRKHFSSSNKASRILDVGCHLGSEKIIVNGEELVAITALEASSSSNLATHSQTVWRAMEQNGNSKFIGSLGKLRYLNLSGASFGGLSSLKYLNLGRIDLSKAAAYWLQILYLLFWSCTCPTVNFPTCPFLFHFSILLLFPFLISQGFDSTIPHWLFNLSSLVHLDLNSNNLQGGLPDAFQNFTSLQLLDLSKNSNIEGEFPRTLGNFTLENMDFGYNKLTGNLQDSLGHLKNLRYLQLLSNSFCGSIPESIGSLSSLQVLYLSQNQMGGIIPDSIGQLSSLVMLELNENSWEGVITEARFANLSNLKQLSITKSSPNVSLVFNISSDWAPPFKLTYINLRSCQGPKFPSWHRTQNELTTMVLNNAAL
ncbi:LRR receptor-like serine/threonine-protein kinase GSO1 [Vitis vinifera]|uniref:LRR receptor-like serine/threonine-protein kinase GSO1 n=1 Tax=Vitis vinifera TaxID=29760 RepID=A0A438EBK1_VITVI|nr:LRR receptor-like serine/threonine-protein kinase GSO1 [Vitis vinifera]